MRFIRVKERGFTLKEILVVLAIIAIMATVALGSMQTARQKARDKERISDLQQIQVALRIYKDKTGSYPSNANGPIIGATPSIDTLIAPHLTAPLQDPRNTGTYRYRYDSSHTCNLTTHRALFAQTMEVSGSGNYNTVCDSIPEAFDASGGTVFPTANSYIILLD